VPADDALGAYMPRQRCPHCGKRLVVEMTVTIRQPAPPRPKPTPEERADREARDQAEAHAWAVQRELDRERDQQRRAFNAQLRVKYPEWDGGGDR